MLYNVVELITIKLDKNWYRRCEQWSSDAKSLSSIPHGFCAARNWQQLMNFDGHMVSLLFFWGYHYCIWYHNIWWKFINPLFHGEKQKKHLNLKSFGLYMSTSNHSRSPPTSKPPLWVLHTWDLQQYHDLTYQLHHLRNHVLNIHDCFFRMSLIHDIWWTLYKSLFFLLYYTNHYNILQRIRCIYIYSYIFGLSKFLCRKSLRPQMFSHVRTSRLRPGDCISQMFFTKGQIFPNFLWWTSALSLFFGERVHFCSCPAWEYPCIAPEGTSQDEFLDELSCSAQGPGTELQPRLGECPGPCLEASKSPPWDLSLYILYADICRYMHADICSRM